MKKLKLAQGFTLIELLVVIAIIGIIAGMIVGVGRAARDSAMRAKAKSMISDIEAALRMYYTDIGTYPIGDGVIPYGTVNLYECLTDEAKYGAGGTNPMVGWNGPYMEFESEDLAGNPSQIMDPWGVSYHYTFATGVNNPNYPYAVNIWSNGAIENPNWWDVYKDLKNW